MPSNDVFTLDDVPLKLFYKHGKVASTFFNFKSGSFMLNTDPPKIAKLKISGPSFSFSFQLVPPAQCSSHAFR